jgi:hypothetical protein
LSIFRRSGIRFAGENATIQGEPERISIQQIGIALAICVDGEAMVPARAFRPAHFPARSPLGARPYSRQSTSRRKILAVT